MDERRPLISIVIPCYNYERYVATAIESVLSQDYPHKEVLVINDGSKDASLAVIQRYAASVRIIDQPNSGHIASLHRGLAETSGELLIFLDADDLLLPGVLSKVAAAWSPAHSKVQWDLMIIDGEGRDLGRKFCYFTPDYDSARVRASFAARGSYRWPVAAGNAHARWFVEQVFPLDIEHGPDGYLNTIAPVYGEVAVLPETLGAYRVHGANRWSTKGTDDSRLPARIKDRKDEIDALRAHASRRGVALPPGNVLDHELAFINYRLMAWKLGLDYVGKEHDSPLKLVESGVRTVLDESYPTKMALAHVGWLLSLLAAPSALGRELIRLRFNRAALERELRRKLSFWRSSPSAPEAGARA